MNCFELTARDFSKNVCFSSNLKHATTYQTIKQKRCATRTKHSVSVNRTAAGKQLIRCRTNDQTNAATQRPLIRGCNTTNELLQTAG